MIIKTLRFGDLYVIIWKNSARPIYPNITTFPLKIQIEYKQKRKTTFSFRKWIAKIRGKYQRNWRNIKVLRILRNIMAQKGIL